MTARPGSITNQPAAGAVTGTEAFIVDQEQGAVVAATAMVIGQSYRIVTLGTTNWQTAGASSGAVVGTLFTCEAAGTGTGTAQLVDSRRLAASALSAWILGAAEEEFQPLDADLSAIAAVAGQTAYGRAFLALTDEAGARSYIGVSNVSQADAEAGNSTTFSLWSPQRWRQAAEAWWLTFSSVVGRAVVAAADQAAARAAIGAASTSTFTAQAAGLVPASGGGTSNFLRADNTFAAPPGGSPGGTTLQVQYNSAGLFAGIPNSTVDGATGTVTLARLIAAANGAASASPVSLTGTWFTGGTSATTYPALLISPTGTTLPSLNTAGTGLLVNAPSGFNGDLFWYGINGTPFLRLNPTGTIILRTSFLANAGIYGDGTNWNLGVSNSTKILNISESGLSVFGDLILGTPTQCTLTVDGPNRLATRRDLNPQQVNIYGTYTSSTNNELLKAGWQRRTENAVFTGSISGTTLTVTAISSGTLNIGDIITAANIVFGTRLVTVPAGGGTGTCTISQTQSVASTTITSGTAAAVIGTEKGSAGGTARAMELQTNATTRIQFSEDGVIRYVQPEPVAANATATLTVADLKTGIITSNTANAADLTLPTGTSVEASFSCNSTGLTMEWSLINTGAHKITILSNTDHTIVGNGEVSSAQSARFGTRRTGTNTFTTYRLS